ncbi:hypothetical protein [Bradyrhizobium sp. SYSU BS000235]|uniref:hypothetical protein n=1 Tax=Bradyrhizobium sp. SYSU BS000235 TaxID=3411332 RepID=UPI003C79308C
MSDFREALKQQGGCGLFMIAVGLFMVGGFIYSMIFGFGTPDNKKFFDDCYRQQTRQYYPGDVPDFAMRAAIAECTNRQRERLGMPNTHLQAN